MDNSGPQRDWARDQVFPVNFFVARLGLGLVLGWAGAGAGCAEKLGKLMKVN